MAGDVASMQRVRGGHRQHDAAQDTQDGLDNIINGNAMERRFQHFLGELTAAVPGLQVKIPAPKSAYKIVERLVCVNFHGDPNDGWTDCSRILDYRQALLWAPSMVCSARAGVVMGELYGVIWFTALSRRASSRH